MDHVNRWVMMLAFCGAVFAAGSAEAGDAKVYPGSGCRLLRPSEEGAENVNFYASGRMNLDNAGESYDGAGRAHTLTCPIPRDVLGSEISYLHVDLRQEKVKEVCIGDVCIPDPVEWSCRILRSTPDQAVSGDGTGEWQAAEFLVPGSKRMTFLRGGDEIPYRGDVDATFALECKVPFWGLLVGYRVTEG